MPTIALKYEFAGSGVVKKATFRLNFISPDFKDFRLQKVSSVKRSLPMAGAAW
jgi:hypothetical protein